MPQSADPGERRRRRSPLTLAALAASAVLTVLLAVPATVSLLRAVGVLEVDVQQSIRDRSLLVGIPNTEAGLRIAEGWLAGVTLPLAVVALTLTVGLALLRPWAREAAMGVYGLGGTLLALLGVHGLLQEPPGRNAAEALVAGLAVAAIAGLLMSSSCCLDVDHAETRKRVKAMRAAEAARRARQGAEGTPYPSG